MKIIMVLLKKSALFIQVKLLNGVILDTKTEFGPTPVKMNVFKAENGQAQQATKV
jgi:hypothetical protein